LWRPAVAVTDQHRPVDGQLVEQERHTVGLELAMVVGPRIGDRTRPSMTGAVIGDHRAAGEGRELVGEMPEGGDGIHSAVQHHEGFTGLVAGQDPHREARRANLHDPFIGGPVAAWLAVGSAASLWTHEGSPVRHRGSPLRRGRGEGAAGGGWAQGVCWTVIGS